MNTLVKAVALSMALSTTAIAFNFGGGDEGNEQSQRQSQGQMQRNSSYNRNDNSSSSRSSGIGVGVAISEGSRAKSGSESGASSDNSVSISQTYQQEDNIRIENTPDAYAPALTTSNGTCMGSSSVGGSGPGVGVSFGTTWTDTECTLRYDAEIMHNLGYKQVALDLMCQSPFVAKAAPKLCKIETEKAKSNDSASNGFINF